MVKGTPELLKKMNRSAILSLLFKEKEISRAELAHRTNLSKPTVSGIVEELLRENIVKESGEGASTKQGGRKPIGLAINPTAAYILGVDIGAYKSLCVLSDLAGRNILRETIFTRRGETDDNLGVILETAGGMIAASEASGKVLGVGIGVPGTTDVSRGVAISAPKLQWRNLPIQKIFQDQFSLPVMVDNDVNMAALGEKWAGAGKEYGNFVFISIGDGIGSGIFMNNAIYRGSRYTAGEIGYMALSKDVFQASPYTFDSYGYFESIASGSAVEKTLHLSCREAFERALRHEPGAVRVIEEMTDYISMGVANIISVLNPEAIIVGGGVSKAGPQLLNPLRSKLARLSPVRCEVVLSELGDEAGVRGCIASILMNAYGINF